MAVNPNFTNANAFTPYGGGSGGLNPTVNSVAFIPVQSNITVLSDQLGAQYSAYGTASLLGISQGGNGGAAGNLRVGDYLEVQEQGTPGAQGLNRVLYGSGSISLQQRNTGTLYPILQVNTSTDNTWAMTNLSSMTSGGNTANVAALMSSLKATFPSNFN